MGGEASVTRVIPKSRLLLFPEATDEGSLRRVMMIKYCHLLASCVSRLRHTEQLMFFQAASHISPRRKCAESLGKEQNMAA